MELLTIGLLALIASETTYLAYRATPKNKIEKLSLLIDTSVLIDGRILSIARSGLVTAPVIVPRSVIRELQYMADKADHEKRERAREGLDMIEQLKRIDGITLTVIDDKGTESGVDERLVELASKYNARLCTIDYNLNKSARAQGVSVVNINELAHAVRIVYLPGEMITIELVQPGQSAKQAVGYLDDGTMVVVDDAKSLIGQSVEAAVTRSLQTAAGRMVFAKLPGNPSKQSKLSASSEQGNAKHMPKRDASRTQKFVRKAAQHGRRRSPEDSLVDLANE